MNLRMSSHNNALASDQSFVGMLTTIAPDGETIPTDEPVYAVKSAKSVVDVTCVSWTETTDYHILATNISEESDTHLLDPSAATIVVRVYWDWEKLSDVWYQNFYFSRVIGGSGAAGFVKIYLVSPPLGYWKAADASSFDNNGGAHYTVVDEGNGCFVADDVFPGILWSDGTLHIATIYHRLSDV